MVDSIGRMPIGRKQAQGRERKALIRKMRKKVEISTDKSRRKLLEARGRYEIKVRQNEEKMLLRKEGRERSLNPTAVSLMPSRKFAKLVRNPANWSAIPNKPKYSGAENARMRIYGKRFEWIERGMPMIEAKEKAASKTAEEKSKASPKPAGATAKPTEKEAKPITFTKTAKSATALGSGLDLGQKPDLEEYKKIFLKPKEEI